MIKQVIEQTIEKIKELYWAGKSDGVARVDNTKAVTKIARNLVQAIVDLSECEWVLEDTILDESFYATQCGIHPSFGPGEPRDLEESGYKYCHYCGGEVKEIT